MKAPAFVVSCRFSRHFNVWHIEYIVCGIIACVQNWNSADIFNCRQLYWHTHAHTRIYTVYIGVYTHTHTHGSSSLKLLRNIKSQQLHKRAISIPLRNLLLHITPCYTICNTNILHNVFIWYLFLRLFSVLFLGRLHVGRTFGQFMSTYLSRHTLYIRN